MPLTAHYFPLPMLFFVRQNEAVDERVDDDDDDEGGFLFESSSGGSSLEGDDDDFDIFTDM